MRIMCIDFWLTQELRNIVMLYNFHGHFAAPPALHPDFPNAARATF